MMTISPTVSTRTKKIITVLILTLIGFTGNVLKLSIGYNIDILFGSIFCIIAVQFIGLRYGLLSALIVSSYSFQLWKHPYAIFIFTAEILWIGLSLRKGRKNILLIDASYWLCAGVPLVLLLYAGVLHTGIHQATVIALKQSINGLFNALIASIAISHLPIRRWLRLPTDAEPVPLFTLIFHLTAAAMMIPALLSLFANQHAELAKEHKRAIDRVKRELVQSEATLSNWLGYRIGTAQLVANLGSAGTLNPSWRLQEGLQHIVHLFPDLHNAYLADNRATTVAFYPPLNEHGESTIGANFIDRPYFRSLQQDLKPVISDVFMARVGVFVPIFTISAPLVKDNKLAGYGLVAVKLESLKKQLDLVADQNSLIYTIVDASGTVVISTTDSRKPLDKMPDLTHGATIFEQDGVSLRIPGATKNRSIMSVWKNSYYFMSKPVGATGWTLSVEYPLTPLQKAAYASATRQLTFVAILFALAIIIAWSVSRRIAQTPHLLAVISKALPEKLARSENIQWPGSTILEFNLLSNNFKESAEALSDKLNLVEKNNEVLEQMVTKRTEELEKQTKEFCDQGRRLNDILTGTNAGTWEWNIQTGELAINERWAEMIGYSLDELQPITIKIWMDFAHPYDLKRSGELLNLHFSESLSYYECEVRMKHKDGHWIWVLDRGRVASWTADGKPLLMSGTHQDITERKQAENELLDIQAQLHGITNSSISAIVMIDARGLISFWNPAAEIMLGYTAQEALGQNLHNLIAPERFHSAFESAHALFSRTGQGPAVGKTVELSAKRKDGVEIPVLLGLSAAEIHGEWNAVGIIQDISEIKMYQQQLIESKHAADAANRAKSEFLANMSHEIRTPMNGVIGMVQLLMMTKLDEEQLEYLQNIETASDNLLSIINDILDLSKVESGRIEFEYADFSLHRCIEESVRMISTRAMEKRLSIDYDITDEVPGLFNGDQLRVKQILLNLLSNAVKFTEKGRLALHANCIKQRGNTYLIDIAVSDTGIGIPAEKLDAIFDAFTQADSSMTRKFGGTGLGLTISKQLAELMGGRLWVKSKEGVGSTFHLELPFEGAAAEWKRDPYDQRLLIDQGASTLTVLVAEDNMINQQTFRLMLNKLGHKAIVADNGQQAFDIWIRGGIDLVLMDIQMPVLNGVEALRAIRSNEHEAGQQSVPIIALTADALTGTKEQLLKEGFNAYLSKPLKLVELQEAVNKFRGMS